MKTNKITGARRGIKGKDRQQIKKVREFSKLHTYKMARTTLGHSAIRKLSFFSSGALRPYLVATTETALTEEMLEQIGCVKRTGIEVKCVPDVTFTRAMLRSVLTA